MRVYNIFIISIIFTIAFLVPLLPFIFNGAPFIGDSWVHLKIARDTIISGHYKMIEYNERWPLVNFLIIFLTEVAGFTPLYSGSIVPFLVGSTTVPLYSLCRRVGLPRLASLFSIAFISFDPLYSYITFSGAIMKETSTYYLVLSSLLIFGILLRKRNMKNHVFTAILIGLGLAFGHHYASLVIFLFLLALMIYSIFGMLRGIMDKISGIITIALIFALVAGAWNILNYLALGAYFPIFDLRDFTLLLASFIVLLVSLSLDRRSIIPIYGLLAFIIVILGLRGGIYFHSHPINPISIWEVRDYIVIGLVSLVGLGLGFRKMMIKSLSVSSISLVFFAFTWGFSYPGFVLLIKSLHYFGILLALGAGFTALIVMRKGVIGKILIFLVILFIIFISWYGTGMALNGLGAYYRGEIITASDLPRISSNLKVLGDTRVHYLMPYIAGVDISSLSFNRLSSNEILLLFKINFKQGFLIGYDWIPTNRILSNLNINLSDKVFDSEYLKVFGG